MDLVSQDIHEHFRHSGGCAECKARDQKNDGGDLMNKYKLSIWGRNFELPLLYECYPDEEVIESQREAFAMFEANSAAVAASLEHVKNYVETDEFARLNGDKIENIFKYVMPKEIFVPHTEKHRNVAIMCNYKFDIEHGIAVLFENGQFKKVGPQDIAL